MATKRTRAFRRHALFIERRRAAAIEAMPRKARDYRSLRRILAAKERP
ncbi:hypothetical protein [Planktothrix phage Pra-JY27]|nr:hypothetical protein [Planktothrix phage Pag-Yong1]WEV89261.1 hypothetical protein [Synechococcus phage MinM2]